MENKHEVGLYIGRFQPFHNGHLSVVREALKHCNHLIIVVGSAKQSSTKRNPFDFELRKELIRRSLRGLGKNCTIIGVNDREEVADNQEWGEYLISEVIRQTGLTPTINFEGHEEIRAHWFDSTNIERREIDRNIIPVSATEIRKTIINNDYNTFYTLTPTGVWVLFDKMRKILLEIENGKI